MTSNSTDNNSHRRKGSKAEMNHVYFYNEIENNDFGKHVVNMDIQEEGNEDYPDSVTDIRIIHRKQSSTQTTK